MIKKSKVVSVSNTALTEVYTVPNGKKCELVMIWISNPDSTNKEFHLEFYDKSNDVSVTLLDGFVIDQKDFVQLGGTENTFVIMKEGDKLSAKGSSGSNFKMLISMKEHNNIIQGG